jgi:hypothetical protein
MDWHSFTLIHGWRLWGIIGGAHNESTCFSFLQMFGIDSRSYPTSISAIMSCMSLCSCRGVCSNSTHISFEQTCSPILWDHGSPSPFPLICWGWFPPFCWWFSSWDGGYFRLRGICLCFGSITTSFFDGPLGMVYELLWDCFFLNDSISGFDLFFKVCGHIVWSHVPPSVSCLFFASRLLTLEK